MSEPAPDEPAHNSPFGSAGEVRVAPGIGDKRRLLKAILPPDLSVVRRVRKLAAEVGASAAFDDQRLFDLQVAVTEACVNAIEHAGKEVVVIGWLLPDRVIIEISSEGRFDLARLPDVGPRSRGLGLPLMASLADQMQVSRLTGQLTRVSLTFLLEPEMERGGTLPEGPALGPRRVKRTRLLEDPRVHGLVLTAREMRERKHLEARLRTQAFHDPLTGLANRALFFDRLENALQRAGRRSAVVAVALIDLDEFKCVNDSLGHAAGDSLLAMVGARLRSGLRAADTAARLGGDEFAVLFADTYDAADLERTAERILADLREPYDICNTRLSATASMGIATSGPTATSTAIELIQQADVALYTTKAQGKDGWKIFDPRMERARVRESSATDA